MATKNLARTVIEGGQRERNKGERHQATRVHRAETRAYLSVARRDPDAADDLPSPKRQAVRLDFNDRLGAAYRFLDAHVGRSWNRTRAALVERFDVRSTAGRHILNAHILRDVAPSAAALGPDWMPKRYYADARGILRKAPVRRWRGVRMVTFDRAAVLGWLDVRKIGRVGTRLFWFVPVRDADKIRVTVASQHVVFTYGFDGSSPNDPLPAFRQARPLPNEDIAFFETLDPKVQEALLRHAPVKAPPTE